jgi:fructose-specific component phosphotransferase system IIB-like protein
MSTKNFPKAAKKSDRKIVEIRDADLRLVVGGVKAEAKPE